MPILSEIIKVIENFAPKTYQESYDNSGLLVGNINQNIEGAILCLDCTEAVIEEAIIQKCNLIIAHHPIIFKGVKSLTGKNYVERIIIKAIEHKIAIYACHTNLDNMYNGVNAKIAQKLGLKNCRILQPNSGTLKQLYVYVPNSHVEKLQNSLFEAGAGKIGNYTNCSFTTQGDGTFLAQANATPHVGEIGVQHYEKETKLEIVFPIHLQNKILAALKLNHPYEEIAFGILNIENENIEIGAGMIGELEVQLSQNEFLALVKQKLNTDCIRFTPKGPEHIQKVALCGGSGSFLLQNAINQKADAYISADFKYHEFFDHENKILITDIGHYESEQFTMEIFLELLSEKFLNFAFQITSVNTNPIQYY